MKAHLPYKVLFFLLVVLLFVVSCTTDLPNRDLLIKEIYDARVEQVRLQKNADCRSAQLEKAEAKVDSILHSLLNADLHDTLNFPSRPIKPSRPKHIIGTVDKFEVDSGGNQ